MFIQTFKNSGRGQGELKVLEGVNAPWLGRPHSEHNWDPEPRDPDPV